MGWGLYRLLELRFAAGDVYPPYSSFRADPLGTRALFEGFELLPDRETRRLMEDLSRLESGRDTTLFVFGTDSELDDVEETEAREIERFMQEGGRVVMTLHPETGKPLRARWRESDATNSPPVLPFRRGFRRPPDQPEKAEANNETGSDTAKKSDSNAATNSIVSTNQTSTNAAPPKPRPRRLNLREDRESIHLVSMRERWGYEVEYRKLLLNDDDVAEPATVERVTNAPALPPSLDWHSATVFQTTNQAWHPLYQRGDQPVLMERSFGRGALVLASDSWFVSNEALRKDRHTTLLAWLAGDNHRLVFDETHLGVELKPGIASLAVRYRLHGLFASLFLLATLFVWKNAVSFVPPHEKQDVAADIVSGKDSSTGFVNLLRRSIAPRDLLAICLAEWKKSCGRARQNRADRLLRMSDVAQVKAAAPVDGYRDISRIVAEKDL
jgi:hypothetical protein